MLEGRYPVRDSLLILDYDRLTSRVAVRMLRGGRICCRILPWDVDEETLEQEQPAGLLLCAAADTPDVAIPPQVMNYQGPILALGAAAAALNAALGGQNGVYAPLSALMDLDYSECPLLNGLASGQRLFKGLTPMQLPEDAQQIAAVGDERAAVGFSLGGARRFGMQVDLEIHDPDSARLLTNFAQNICGCTPWWDDEAFVRQAVEDIRQATGEGNAVCLMTGGLYSNVTSLLAAKALGDRLTCVYVDTGLLQDDEEEDFFELFSQRTGLNVIREDHRDRFLQALKGVRDPMDKRRTIESILTVIRRDVQRSVPLLNAVIRGRSYMERLSQGEEILGLRAGVLCVEPLRDLFTEEVRQIGRFLGMPEEILSRQAIPATGLALNIRGEVTAERLDILRTADGIYRRLMQEGNQIRRLGTLYTNLEPVGNYYSIILNALTASDIGLPRAARVPYDILESVMEEIQAACPKVRRVVYNLSPNPTI